MLLKPIEQQDRQHWQQQKEEILEKAVFEYFDELKRKGLSPGALHEKLMKR